MPNHVTTQIKFFGEQPAINLILKYIAGEDTCIDFNKIIPMPDDIYMGSLGPDERRLYGSNNWYDWRVSHWGTKWNAYSTSFDADENILSFDTAWSCPIPILEELSMVCAEYGDGVLFEGHWADEDCGCNVGTFDSGDDGSLSYHYVENNSQEAYNIYVELKGETCTLHQDENGDWVYHGCDNCPNPC